MNNMISWNVFAGTIALFLTSIAYIPYIRDVFLQKTTPHIFTWFVWFIVTFIIYLLQIAEGGGFGSIPTLLVAMYSFCVFIFSFRCGITYIQKSDVLFLLLAIMCVPLWVLIDKPILSIIILCSIDVLGFFPTVRKAWIQPYSETMSFYSITMIRHGMSVVALSDYNIITVLFPFIWFFINALFIVMLIFRRKKVAVI